VDLSVFDRLESNVRGYVRSFPTIFQSASGSWLTDTQGRRYLDFFAGAGTLNYGHNNPRVKEALIDYLLRDGVMHGLDTATHAKQELLLAFEEIILKPRGLDFKLQFTGPTGTNCVEAAIKLARKVKQRTHIVAFTNAYHGHSLGALALTGNQYYHDVCYGSHDNVSHLPFDGYLGDFDTSLLLEKMIADASSGLPLPAAVILETVQGEGGINVASNRWLQSIEQICRENDILLIIDDIQVGNGRTGSFFSFEPAGIKPDMICISKAIGGGLPMSLLLIQRELDQWRPGQHTGTFRGNNLAFVACRALLELWRDDHLVNHVRSLSELFQGRLMELQQEFAGYLADVRGRGLVWGIDTGVSNIASNVCKEAFARGLIIETAGAQDQVIKLLPPLTSGQPEILYGLQLLHQSIAAVVNRRNSEPVAVPSLSLGILESGSMPCVGVL
jgi:diaminobutyrate-2-oxoglutarate transaminase